MRKKKLDIQITQREDEKPVPARVLAEEILSLAKAMKKLSETRLTREAIVALVHDRSGVAKKTIHIVLNNLDSLEETWLKKLRST